MVLCLRRRRRLVLLLTLETLLWWSLAWAPAQAQEVAKPSAVTSNLNVLFLGVNGNQLLMTSVLSINYHDQMQTVALFFSPQTLFTSGGKERLLNETFRRDGPGGVVAVLEEQLGVHLAYYIKIDESILPQVEATLGPLAVEGRVIPLAELFTMAVGPDDDKILGRLLAKLSQPQVYFWYLPRLVLATHQKVTTDFKPTPANLWLHYRIINGVDARSIQKEVLRGRKITWRGSQAWKPDPHEVGGIILEATTGPPQGRALGGSQGSKGN